jgi:hypothetical protein
MMNAMTVANDDTLAEMIAGALRRVVLVTPAFGPKVGEALAERWEVLGRDAVTVIIDMDAEVYRLGYGSFAAVTKLDQKAAELGAMLNQQRGVRIGVLIVDDEALTYSPTPLLIEAGPRAEKSAPNAIRLGLPPADLERDVGAGPDGVFDRTLGEDKADRASLVKVQKQLEDNPPQKFDVARTVRVFNAYFEFVEFTLTGALLDRRIVPLPPDLFGVTDPAAQKKLRATFRLIEPGDLEFSGEYLMDDRRRIAKKFLRSIPGYGQALKRSDKDKFNADVEKLKAAVETFKDKVAGQLKAVVDHNRQSLVEALVPTLLASPPPRLKQSAFVDLTGSKTEREASIRAFVDEELKLDDPQRFLSGMKVNTLFKAPPYEMLCNEQFRRAAEGVFPDLPNLHEEHDAAPEVPNPERFAPQETQ